MIYERILGLVRALRTAGVKISPAESVDALKAVAAVGVADRELIRSALLVTLIKERNAQVVFQRLFDVFFPLAPHRAGDAMDDEGLREALLAALDREGSLDLANLAGEAVERFGKVDSSRAVAGSYYAYRTLRGIDFDGMKRQLMQGLKSGADFPFANDSRPELAKRLEALSAMVEQEVWSRLAQSQDPATLARSLDIKMPEDVDIILASKEELRALNEAVRPLAAKLVAKLERRHRARNAGVLDFRKTIRVSLSTGGVPIYPVSRKRKPHRPEVVVLADVSGSVAAFARFTLQLLYALSSELAKLRSFVFIDAVDEVTSAFFSGTDMEAVLRQIGRSAKVVGASGHSDYGAIFSQFARDYLNSFDERTTLLVLGDARSNYHDPQVERLKEISARVGAIYWLNPEPKAYWNTGDSMMREYSPYCAAVAECRTLRQLERFVAKAL
jgi:uncharacterized protein with von Willebrand factor type A (vWA) domain